MVGWFCLVCAFGLGGLFVSCYAGLALDGFVGGIASITTLGGCWLMLLLVGLLLACGWLYCVGLMCLVV